MQPTPRMPTYGTTTNTSNATAGPSTGTLAPGSSKGQEGQDEPKARPRLMFMGQKGAGKRSIKKVVFERLAPNDTLFIEKTAKSTIDDINSFVSIQVWDLPAGAIDPGAYNVAFEELDAVIFVLDGQGPVNDMIRKLAFTMSKAFDAKPTIQFEIFLHKIEAMSSEYRLDTLQNLRDRLTEELFDMSPELESSVNAFYHLTSVFDTTIYEALSKVIQKLIPEQAMLERLLDLLCQQSSMDKAFLFDTSSKIYIATDSSPLDNQTYVICSDYIDLVGDFTLLYEPSPLGTPIHSRSPSSGSKANTLAPMTRMDSSAVIPPSSPSRRTGSSDATRIAKGTRVPSSKVKLATGATIAQWAISSNLSLVALLRPHMMEQHAALIDYNVTTFREAVLAIFDLEMGQKKD